MDHSAAGWMGLKSQDALGLFGKRPAAVACDQRGSVLKAGGR